MKPNSSLLKISDSVEEKLYPGEVTAACRLFAAVADLFECFFALFF